MNHFFTRHRISDERGFTLVELLVSVMIFTAVMLVAIGSLLSMVDANRKAQSIKSAVNNLSFALDAMSRQVRTGSTIHCGAAGALSVPTSNCTEETLLAFENFNGNPSDANDQIVYCQGNNSTCSSSGTSILRSTNGGATYAPITSPEVTIVYMHFNVIGGLPGDGVQPKIVMTLKGYAGTSDRTRTTINLETMMTTRLLDE